jgi:FdhD protein
VTDRSGATRTATTDVRVTSLRGGSLERPDRVVTEEPLEIRAGGPGDALRPLAVTMRTPGHDFELAAGFLHGEGFLRDTTIRGVRYCDVPPDEQQFNIVTVLLDRPLDPTTPTRAFTTSSSCGMCGKASIEEVEAVCARVISGPPASVPASVITALPDGLRRAQRVFGLTGGLHAAGLFTSDGDLLLAREDVGRHNAVDKIVGHGVLDGSLPYDELVLMVSGRVSFEIVQKAAMAGIPVLCAVSAPSSLAVDAAERLGVTLVGFLRDGSGNVYTHRTRIDPKR